MVSGFLEHKKEDLKILYSAEQIEDKVYIGRTQGDAEEIDSIVYVKSENKLNIGDFVNVKITSALEYDLMGDIVNELA